MDIVSSKPWLPYKIVWIFGHKKIEYASLTPTTWRLTKSITVLTFDLVVSVHVPLLRSSERNWLSSWIPFLLHLNVRSVEYLEFSYLLTRILLNVVIKVGTMMILISRVLRVKMCHGCMVRWTHDSLNLFTVVHFLLRKWVWGFGSRWVHKMSLSLGLMFFA